MSKQQKVFAILICISVTAGLALTFFRHSEPSYRNIPLSEWLSLHRSYQFRNLSHVMLLDDFRDIPARDTLGPHAAYAIRQIGTNALPSLIAWMRQPESAWKRKLAAVVGKLPSAVRPNKVPGWLDYRRDGQRASLAFAGFGILRSEAAPAIPALAGIVLDTNALGAVMAVYVLGGIGKPAVPALAGLLSTNAASATKVDVMNRLGYLGPNAADAVPALILCLNSFDDWIAKSAARALGRIASRSEIAIPALLKCLDDSRYSVRLTAIMALGEFGGDALPAKGSLSNLVSQPDLKLSEEAETALIKISSASSGEPIGPEAGPFGEILPGLR